MSLSPKEITALKYKIMDFIQENDPFGAQISQHELLCLAQYFADAATAKAGVVGCPVDKWLLMMVKAIFGEAADIRNLGDVRWHATEDSSQGKGTGRHIAMFILRSPSVSRPNLNSEAK